MTKIPDHVLEKYRHINVEDHDWWQWTVDDFCAEMQEKHGLYVEPKHVQFSGFWSQGDGASFTGTVMDIPKFLANFKGYEHLRAEGDDLCITIQRSTYSRYVHENTVSVTTEPGRGPRDDFEYALWELNEKQRDEEIEEFDKEATEFVRDLCHDLYKRLEEDYEHHTSDEQVAEAIEANQLWLPDDEEV